MSTIEGDEAYAALRDRIVDLERQLAEAREALKRMVGRFGGSGVCSMDLEALKEAREALAALTMGKEAVPTARLCTVERAGLACAPDKHHPDCPMVRKEAGG